MDTNINGTLNQQNPQEPLDVLQSEGFNRRWHYHMVNNHGQGGKELYLYMFIFALCLVILLLLVILSHPSYIKMVDSLATTIVKLSGRYEFKQAGLLLRMLGMRTTQEFFFEKTKDLIALLIRLVVAQTMFIQAFFFLL